MPLTNAQRAAMKKRKTTRRKYTRKYRPSRKYADGKSFKLTGTETRWFSSPDGSGLAVQSSGPNIGIDKIQLRGSGASQTASFGGSAYMCASNTTQWTQLNTLFDRYKINGVKYTFIPEFNMAQVQGSGVLPVIKIVRDYDDNIVGTVGDIWSRQGKVYRFTRPISVYVKPKILVSTLVGNDSSGSLSGFSLPQRPQFVNSGFGNIPHVGLKFAVKDWMAPTGLGGNVNVTCRVETVYYLSLREQFYNSAPGHDGLAPAYDGSLNAGKEEETPCENKPVPEILSE